MKKLLFLLLTFGFLANVSLSAQSLSVSGVIADLNGQTVSGIPVHVSIDSSVVGGFIYNNTVYSDANGFYTDTIDLPANTTQGAVLLSMEDCDSNYVTVALFFNPGNYDLTQDFTYCANNQNCGVFINEAIDQDNNGNIVYSLTADAFGTPPYTYAWSTNENTQTIEVTQEGSYCVTVADANGCTATSCYYFIPYNGTCSVTIQNLPFGGLLANSGGLAPYTYQWSSGEVSETIFPANAGLYCVTITDATGCTAEDCFDYDPNPIDTTCFVELLPIQGGFCLEALGYGTPPFAYKWNTGETGQVICFNAPGEYCVTLTDATGCQSTACYDTSNDPCSVAIEVDSTNGTTDIILTAVADGTPPFTYFWDNAAGQNSPSITVSQSGTYCVEVVDANGCVAFACITIIIDGNTPCDVSVQLSGAGDLVAVPNNPNMAVTYLWSTGETTSSITPAVAGDYCVTITTADGCTATDCYYYDPNCCDSLNVIFGQIFTDNNQTPNLFGLAYLIVFDDLDSSLTAIDTVVFTGSPVGGGSYYVFENVPDGDYLVKVALDPNSMGYADHLPTYYGDVLFWHEATTVTVPGNANISHDIYMVIGNNPGGPGFIGGLVSEGANLKGENPAGFGPDGEGDPMPDVSVLLLDENEEAVTHAVTDEEGKFGFENLDWGTYKVIIEIMGMEQEWYWVTIGPDQPSVGGIHFEVGESEITVTSTSEAQFDATAFGLFPNPATNDLNIRIDNASMTQFELNVFDLQGQRWLMRQESAAGQEVFSIDVSELPEGLYFVEVIGNGYRSVQKFVKQ